LRARLRPALDGLWRRGSADRRDPVLAEPPCAEDLIASQASPDGWLSERRGNSEGPVSHRPHLTRTRVTTRATNAEKSRPAAVACEYSQSRRKASQLSGVIVQLCVAWFTGYVKIAKITSEAATQTNAIRAPLNTRGSLRLVRASINVPTVAPTTTN